VAEGEDKGRCEAAALLLWREAAINRGVVHNPLSIFSHSPTVSIHSHQDTRLQSMFRAQPSSHERVINFHVSLK
jgi:hypothetical protein